MAAPLPRRPGTAGVPSPCVNVCRMHAATGWCEGCLRTLDEIAAWGGAGDAERRAVLALLPERRRQWRALRPVAAPAHAAGAGAAAPAAAAVAPPGGPCADPGTDPRAT